ncbi:MAG: hypothetical protein COA67_09395 [Lutibacter sp.]|nr:MAG: hypothetical protein COA67_09395 [Lutibacter sp.]
MKIMKPYVLLILFIFSYAGYSQTGMSTIYFLNGKILKKKASIGINNVIVYGRNLDYNDIERVEFEVVEGSRKIEYEYVYLEKKKKPILMEIIYKGSKTTLYSRKAYIYNTNLHNTITEEFGHYGKKYNSKYAVKISLQGTNAIYGNKFKKKGAQFFSDCPKLSELIKLKKIKNKDKIKAFEYYEKECN